MNALRMIKPLSKAIVMASKCLKRIKMYLLMPLFKSFGRRFVFDPGGIYSFANIVVGDDVSIGPGAHFSASNSLLTIGDKVMFGPNVTIMCGDHNIHESGAFMKDVSTKRPGDDIPVEVADDVWVGCGATILKGVHVGRGAVIAAGALVTRDVPPYTIVAGIPAKPIRLRWSLDDVIRHEESLYPSEQRISRDEIATITNLVSRH